MTLQEKMTTHALWVNGGKSKLKKLKSGLYTFLESYIKGALRKKQYNCFFGEAPKISKISITHQNKKTKIRRIYILKT